MRLTPERKETWRAMAEKRGYGLSEFVRHAVDNEIEGRNGTPSSVDGDDVAEAVGEVLDERLGDVDGRLSAVESAVTSLQDEVGDDGGSVSEGLVFEELPNVAIRERNDGGEKVTRSEDEVRSEAKTAAEVAADIGVPVAPVRRTLERMAVESERVRTTEHGEEVFYFANV